MINYTVCQSNYDDCNTRPFGNSERCSTNPPFFGKSSSKSSEVYTPAEFQENIAWFLDDSPGESCATAGKAAYRWENLLGKNYLKSDYVLNRNYRKYLYRN